MYTVQVMHRQDWALGIRLPLAAVEHSDSHGNVLE
jgi:hypothetical protein